ncbi:MAG: alpha/beta hydrolase [Erysipelotrichaceae bacterium]|nr:alpha/beta hydrolase [Erysipelotrichaceae bacterium]
MNTLISFPFINFNVFFNVLGILLALFIAIHLIESIYLKRSFFSSVIETYLHYSSKRKKHAKSKRKFNKYLKRHKERSDLFVFPKKLKLNCNIEECIIDNKQVYKLFKTSDVKLIIIYLHGGAYISQPVAYQWKFCASIANSLDVEIIFPIYPLTPNHHFDEAFDFIDKIYNEQLKRNIKILLMGDSSGGGLAMSYLEYLANNNLKQPTKTILISPWLDLSMSQPQIYEYERKDPMLAIAPLKKSASLWANNNDLKDYRISPFFGNVKNINNVTLFTGTREILYPEINAFYTKLKDNNVDAHLYVGNNMNHDFPLYPINEAKKAMKYILDLLHSCIDN